jgi:DNA-binding transcriptional regulator YhcF (GntR family)
MIHKLIHIDDTSPVPKYQQIINSIRESVKVGLLKKGHKLPSINEICEAYPIARETIVKAYDMLREQGTIESVRAKGFYIASIELEEKMRVLLLLDTFTAYKEVLYGSINEYLGDKATVDLLFHHFNINVFSSILKENAGKYTTYILLPFDHEKINEALGIIPQKKIYLLDRYPKAYKNKYVGIYQDFRNDVFNTLDSISKNVHKYQKLIFIFRNTVTDPPKEIINGFEKFCKKEKINFEVVYKPFSGKVKKGEAYLVVDDEDLVSIIISAKEQQFEFGKDVGIISYNETSLKKVIGNGISVISTDFYLMGKNIAQMILDGRHDCIVNPSAFNDRGSF